MYEAKYVWHKRMSLKDATLYLNTLAAKARPTGLQFSQLKSEMITVTGEALVYHVRGDGVHRRKRKKVWWQERPTRLAGGACLWYLVLHTQEGERGRRADVEKK